MASQNKRKISFFNTIRPITSKRVKVILNDSKDSKNLTDYVRYIHESSKKLQLKDKKEEFKLSPSTIEKLELEKDSA